MEVIKNTFPCNFKYGSIMDNILKGYLELTMKPQPFSDVKPALVEAFEGIKDEKIEDNISNKLYKMIIVAITAYKDKMWEFVDFKSVCTTEDFHNKDLIFNLYLMILFEYGICQKFPQDEEYLELYKILFQEVNKSISSSNKVCIYGTNVDLQIVSSIVLFTNKMTEETIKPFINTLFDKHYALTEIGVSYYKVQSPEFFVKTAPKFAFYLENLFLLGTKKVKDIIDELSVENFNFLLNSLSFISNVEIKMELIHKCVKYMEQIHCEKSKLAPLFKDIHLSEITEEVAHFMSINNIFLSNKLVSDLQTSNQMMMLLPIIKSLDMVPSNTIDYYIQNSDFYHLDKILKLAPKSSVLADIQFWIKLAKSTEAKEWSYGKAMIKNIPVIGDSFIPIISNLEPDVAMRVFNSLILEKKELFSELVSTKEYWTLLYNTTVALPCDLPTNCIFEKEGNYISYPPQIYLLLSKTNVNYRIPNKINVPTLLQEDIDYFIHEMDANNTFVPKGSNLILLKAYAQSANLIIGNGSCYEEINDSNKLILMTLFVKWRPNDKKHYLQIFKYLNAVYTFDDLVVTLEKPKNQTEEKLMLIFFREYVRVMYDMNINFSIVRLHEKMVSFGLTDYDEETKKCIERVINQEKTVNLKNVSIDEHRAEFTPEKINEDALNLDTNIGFKNFGVLLASILNDEETSAYYYQLQVEKQLREFVIETKQTIKIDEGKNQEFIEAINSQYLPYDSFKIVRRMKPTEKPPSDYFVNIVDSLIQKCRENHTFYLYELLHLIASLFLPAFKYIKTPAKEIFDICFEAKHNSTEYSPIFGAIDFLERLIQQPQYADDFFDYIFENINYFNEIQLIIATSLIYSNILREETAIATMASLIKHNWSETLIILQKYKSGVIFDNVTKINEIFSNISNIKASMKKCRALVECDTIFSIYFNFLPVVSESKALNEIEFFKDSQIKQIREAISEITLGSKVKTDITIKDLTNKYKWTDDISEDPLPSGIKPSLISPKINIKARTSTIKRRFVELKMVPELYNLLMTKGGLWAIDVYNELCGKNKNNAVGLPSHFIRILGIVKEIQELDKPTKLRNIIDFSSKYSYFTTEVNNELVKTFELSELADNFFNTIKEQSSGSIITYLKLFYSFIHGKQKDEVIALIPRIIISVLRNFDFENNDIIEYLAKFIEEAQELPERFEFVLMFSFLGNSKCISSAIKTISRLEDKEKEKYSYCIDYSIKRVIANRDIATIRKLFDIYNEKISQYNVDIAVLIESMIDYKGITEEILELLMLISPKANKSNTFSISANKYNIRLPISEECLKQNLAFWRIIETIIPYISSQVLKNPCLIKSKYKLLCDFPQLIPYTIRKNKFLSLIPRVDKSNTFNLRNISRNNIIKDTMSKMPNFTYKKIPELHVKFLDEIGQDEGGLRKDLLCSLVKEFSEPQNKIFEENKTSKKDEKAFDMIPAKDSDSKTLIFAGKILALCIIYNITVPIHLSRGVLKRILGHGITIEDLNLVDPDECKTLKNYYDLPERVLKIAEYPFTDPYSNEELKKGGANIFVTKENLEEYVALRLDYYFYGFRRNQIDAFVSGFHQVIPQYIFNEVPLSEEELDLIIFGQSELSVEDFFSVLEYEGYTENSKTIKCFRNILSRWSSKQRSFLFYLLTSSYNIPVNKSNFKVTIISTNNVERVPTVSTCFLRFYLPDYKDEKLLENKLEWLVTNGMSFSII